MRRVRRIVISISILLLSTLCYSQNDVLDEIIDLDYSHITIEALLDSLHKSYAYNFSYDPSDLPVDSVLRIDCVQCTLFDVLQDVFKNYDLSFESVGKQVILSHRKRELALRNYITIQGSVISSDKGQCIPLANMAIKGEPLGTTTNMEGAFTFLVPQEFVGAELMVSSIGFKPERIHVPPEDSAFVISLQPQTIQMKEIKVRYISPDEIMRRMVENRAKNYFTNPLLLSAFFRESVQQDGKYIEVSEAVLDIYKSSYLKTLDLEDVRFVKGRKKVEVEDVSVARLKLAGGPALFSTIDVAKHLDFVSKKGGVHYLYVYNGKEIVHNRVVYKVGFKPMVEVDDINYEGELFVDVETFALLRADFSMTKKTLRKSDRYLILKKAKRVKSIPVFTRYEVDYRPYGDKWILNSVRGELVIKMQDKRNKTKSEYQAFADLLITNAQKGRGRRIRYSEIYKTKYVLADKIVGYDPVFWKDYNVIHPEEELENVFKSTPIEINLVPQPRKTKP